MGDYVKLDPWPAQVDQVLSTVQYRSLAAWPCSPSMLEVKSAVYRNAQPEKPDQTLLLEHIPSAAAR